MSIDWHVWFLLSNTLWLIVFVSTLILEKNRRDASFIRGMSAVLDEIFGEQNDSEPS